MNIKDIKELLDLFTDSGIAEMEVQRGDNRVKLRRDSITHEAMAPAAHALSVPAAAAPASSSKPAADAPVKPAEAASTDTIVKSPIVGTYYDAPSPDAPSFVKVGDTVEPGKVLCIIESMKLMNEIEAEVTGTIVEKLCENGRPVEYGQPLFAVRPR